MITATTLAAIADTVRHNADLAPLRLDYPGLRFTACNEDDIPARVPAVCDAGQHLLYLVGSLNNGHCLALTDDLEAATGVVVAAKADDE